MLSEEFDKIVEERVEKIKSILISKAKEYASDTDRLHNFKVAARVDNESPEKALWGMAKKHLVCIMDMVSDTNGIHKMNITREYIDEKIGDMANYMILLEALLKERVVANTIVRGEAL